MHFIDFRRHVCLALSLVAALMLHGCATFGKEYSASNISRIELGKTSRAQIVALFGSPQEESTTTYKKDVGDKDLPQPIIATILRYYFSAPSASGAVAGSPPNRWLNVLLVDDATFAYFSSSSFKEDPTDFDVAKAGGFERGKTTKDMVVSTLGAPSGKGIYPFAVSAKGTGYFYSVDLKNMPPGSTTHKRVRVFFNPEDIVEDFSVNANTEAMPIAPVPVTIPVYIPSGKK
ncbi:MAG: hypothetical protein QM749_03980 [Aquabacterium sp.]